MLKGYKDYIKYLKDNPDGYWFKRRAFGWGWVPVKWQGWLTTFIYIVAILYFAFRIDDNTSDSEVINQLLIPLVILTAIFITIAYKTGEKPKWTWGFPKSEKNNDSTENQGGNNSLNKSI